MKSPSAPNVIAHRGASGYRPEHSRSAYQLAIDLGADAVEPDIVSTRDDVLVIRHENEISGTTDIATHAEFFDRRTTKTIDGDRLTGWFTEDFTWDELQTLRVRERLPKIRSTVYDGTERMLRLRDLIDLLDARGDVGMVAEIKHPTYFASIGIPLDELFAAEISAAGWAQDPRLTVECFETKVLSQVRSRGIDAKSVFLIESSGAPADQVAEFGASAREFADYLTDDGLGQLAASDAGNSIDGISVDKRLLLQLDSAQHATGITDVVDRAHAAGLDVFCWTLRTENRFLAKNFRLPGGAAQYGDWMSEFQLIMRSGVDAVFADQPDLAIEARSVL